MNKLIFSVIIAVGIAFIFATHYFFSKIEEDRKRIDSNIGKSIIIYGDTTTVMSYNSQGCFYLLSNGKIVGYKELNKTK
jgi:hypothetical protein